MRLSRIHAVPLSLGALCGVVGAAGIVIAQPAEPAAPVTPTEAAPTTPAPEEAPPSIVAPPAPAAVAPITATEVAPASAPVEKVAVKPVPEPIRRARQDIAILQAIDKVTAETLRFEAAVGRPVRWKGLVFTVSACERSAPDEAVVDSAAYLTIISQPRPQPGRPTPPSREAFRGWMYAASPGLNPLEHATYDAWVISCRTSRPETPPVAPPKPVPTPKPKAVALPAPIPAPAAKPPEPVAPPPPSNP